MGGALRRGKEGPHGLRTSYLQQHHKGEPLWHLCNEPFDYSKVMEERFRIPDVPTARALNRHYPNANHPQLAIEFSNPERDWALVEILDSEGNNLEVIVSAICERGYHMAVWNTGKYASGDCKYRLRYRDFNEAWDLVLNRA